MADPAVMQAAMQARMAGAAGGAATVPPPQSFDLGAMMQLLNQNGAAGPLAAGAAAATPAAPPANPGQLYAAQLQTLTEMGFFDADANLRALVATGGNVQAAVERLLG